MHPTTPASTGYDVFISHTSTHKPWVLWLAQALRAQGYRVFLDIWDLVPGDSFASGLDQGVQESRAAVLVATPDVVNSGWVRQEYDRLMARRRTDPKFKLVPIVFGEVPHLPFLQDVLCVDGRDPARFRHWFHALLCGLKGQPPGPLPPALEGLPAPPSVQTSATSRLTPTTEADFVQRVIRSVHPPASPPALVAVRGQRHLGAFIHRLRQRAQAVWGEPALLHVSPPFSPQDNTDACFADMGRQAQLTPTVTDAASFAAALDKRLAQAPQFVLVTGFDNAHPHVQHQLASTLRSLLEHHVNHARVVLLGGEKLVRQKFASGDLSLLSHATVTEWPDPSLADLQQHQQLHFPDLPLDDAQAQALWVASGGHAGLMHHGLATWEAEGGTPNWPVWCHAAPDLWQTWYALKRHQPEALRSALCRERFGPRLTWSPDDTTRRLYWADLLRVEHGSLVWRSAQVQQVGAEVLA